MHLLTRRQFSLSAASSLLLAGCHPAINPFTPAARSRILVNDSQSRLNATYVADIRSPSTPSQVADLIRECSTRGLPLAVCGGKHAMGGQQFATDGMLLDTNGLNAVDPIDTFGKTVTVGAGIRWPALIESLNQQQSNLKETYTIREKQTGVDEVSLGGTVAANAHGRGLTTPPFVHDVEKMVVALGNGELVECSRTENAELFSLIVGGYGLFGIVCNVTLRLVPRRKVRRSVEVILLRDLPSKIEERIQSGFLYGDCQYSIDLRTEPGEYPGVLSCYKPTSDHVQVSPAPRRLTQEDWIRLYELTRKDKRRAFEEYSRYYLSTDGQVYWSDTHQLAGNFFDAYRIATRDLNATEMLTEVYVPHGALLDFLLEARSRLLGMGADLTYGTIRFIEKDRETFLPWARDRMVCVVCNLNVVHTPSGIQKAAHQFRELINAALKFEGGYYLTYHRWASKPQLLRAYPQFEEFLKLKQHYDPTLLFQSDWFQAYRQLLS